MLAQQQMTINRLKELPMKKLVLGAAIALAPIVAMAHPAGCGLGTAVVFKSPGSWVEHVLAATTNGTSGNQTFGMTSGTLGCEAAGGPLASGVDYFIDQNIDQIALESSQGQGETLDALAELIGVADQDKSAFMVSMQSNFDSLFPNEETSSSQVYFTIADIMSHNARLSKYLAS
jgi:hypothetical protein